MIVVFVIVVVAISVVDIILVASSQGVPVAQYLPSIDSCPEVLGDLGILGPDEEPPNRSNPLNPRGIRGFPGIRGIWAI